MDDKTSSAIEFKDQSLEIKKLAEDGTFEGYASTFGNVDSYGDIIAAEAFDKAIREAKKTGKYPKLLWQHNTGEPIGVFTEMKKTAEGLYVTGRLSLAVAKAKEAYALLHDGALDGMSIGFSASKYEIDAKTGVRTIKEVKLFEISLVTFPANEMARVVGVKSDDMLTKRECERNLRDAGYSQSEAKAISAKAFGSQRDVDSVADIKAAIESTINTLKGLTNGQH